MRDLGVAPGAQLRFVTLPSGARLAWAANGRRSPGVPTLVRAAHWMTHVEQDPRSAIWQPWLEGLGRTLQVVRYDERGCGSSSDDGTPPGLDASVQELQAVVAAQGEDRIAVLGLSGSCAPAIAFAAQHPRRVSHLVLHGGYALGVLRSSADGPARAYCEAQIELMARGWGRPGSAVQQFFTSTMLPGANPAQAAALNEQQRLSCSGERAAALLRARASIDVRSHLAAVRCPTLVLHSDGDQMVPPERGRELAAGIAGARFELLRSRNHIPLADEPAFARFCEAITDFVGAQRPPDARGFTRREHELLAAVALGLDNQQIAARLAISDKTVRNALSLLYRKLDVEGRPQAVVRAREMGFG